MSIQYDARVRVVSLYPALRSDAVELFLSICGVSRGDFEFEECVTVEEYLYPAAQDFRECEEVES